MRKILFVGLVVLLLCSAFTPIFNIELTPQWLALWTGSIVSLLFSYFPGFNTWYAGKSEDFKRFFMLGSLILISVVLFAGMCFNLVLITGSSCSVAGFFDFLNILLLAIVSNQSIFMITVQTPGVRMAVTKRDALIGKKK